MSLRNISRNKSRFVITLLGVVCSVGLLIISFFTNDAVDYMMQKYFNVEKIYDLSVRFNSLTESSELYYINRMDGVQKVEGFLELPVKMHFRNRSEDEILLAYPPDLTMRKLEGDNGQLITPPEDGIYINKRTAVKLGIKRGELVEVETLLPTGPVHREKLLIVGTTSHLVGGGSYIGLAQANRLLQEGNAVSGAMIKVDPGKSGSVEKEINKISGVSSVLSRQKELQNFQKNLASMVYSISIMVIFAVILGFAIVYNASVISFAERQREIASLRVMGFSSGEISGLLLRENLLQSVLGIVLGLPFGRYLAEAYVQSVNTDLYSLPVIIYPLTYLFSALGGIIFITAAHRFAVRGIKDMDIVAALKNVD